jgi:hypothetical protein
MSERGITVAVVNGPPSAEIIDTFMSRASRVINSELVDATKARLEEGYKFSLHMLKDGGYEVSWLETNEYIMKGLAADLRPFFPWVDDTVKLTRVMRAVLISLTDPQFKRTLIWIRDEYMKMMDNTMAYSHWAIPHEQWTMSMTDMDLAKTVLNSQWFHEGLDPKIRHLLQSDHQRMANYQAVSRLINITVLGVTLLKKFIVEADDAGVLNPKTR